MRYSDGAGWHYSHFCDEHKENFKKADMEIQTEQTRTTHTNSDMCEEVMVKVFCPFCPAGKSGLELTDAHTWLEVHLLDKHRDAAIQYVLDSNMDLKDLLDEPGVPRSVREGRLKNDFYAWVVSYWCRPLFMENMEIMS